MKINDNNDWKKWVVRSEDCKWCGDPIFAIGSGVEDPELLSINMSKHLESCDKYQKHLRRSQRIERLKRLDEDEI